MITTSLSPVVAFLRRHGRGLECLEGATTFQELDEEIGPIFNAVHMWCIDGDIDLWLGRSEICSAALGWAAEVLAVAKGVTLPHLVLLSAAARYVRIERDGILHEWRWDTAGNTPRLTSMPDPTPSTPAERLAAVLKYEVER